MSKIAMYVYILKSVRANRHYIGLTGDIDHRFLEHNSGWVNKTRFYKPYLLIHVEIASTREEARKMEKFFKSGYGREVVKEIEETLEI